MISSLRQTYNAAFTPDRYQAMIAGIHADLPGQLDFRVAETPIFVPKALADKIFSACDSIVAVLTDGTLKARTEAAIPPGQNVPNEDDHAQFLAIDFAVCRNAETGELEPQLIELQGFPSLYGFQAYLPQQFRKFFPIPETVRAVFNVNGADDYVKKLRDVIVGDCDPEQVILLEIYPEKQKTRIDFELTRRHLSVAPVCLTKIKKQGRKLFYEKDGRLIQIKRIYNRLIFDELQQKYPDLKTEFSLTDDVDVTWVGHPNWFFRISKYALPLLSSPGLASRYVPPSHYLSDLETYPADLDNYVLKPLFSFAGAGVKLNITPADLDAIPASERGNFLIQRKVQYEPVIQAVDGGLVKCEIRMLFVWPEHDSTPTLITNLGRLSRGAMIGVDFNKNFDWVGGTVCFFEQ